MLLCKPGDGGEACLNRFAVFLKAALLVEMIDVDSHYVHEIIPGITGHVLVFACYAVGGVGPYHIVDALFVEHTARLVPEELVLLLPRRTIRRYARARDGILRAPFCRSRQRGS